MKTMVKIFVDYEHLVRVVNTLTELGITGFYHHRISGNGPKDLEELSLE